MGVESGLAGTKGKEFCDLPAAASNKKSKKNRRRQRKQTLVQSLFSICKEVFANGGTGFVPPPEDVERIRSALDSIKAEDVGLTPDMPFFRRMKNRKTPPITYLHIFECSKFSMGIFCLPPSGVIPLHNHPGMTVFSKLLFGKMHIKSYDWAIDNPPPVAATSQSQAQGARLAKLQVDAEFTAPNTSILYPASGGNLHCFTAVTACCVLDVLGPPYADDEGRDCTYYLEYPFDTFSAGGADVAEDEKQGYAWLKGRGGAPHDLVVDAALYQGPKFWGK